MVSHDDKFRVLRKLPEVRFEEELRGYSKSQVDRVLQSLAPLSEDVSALQNRLAAAESRAAAAEARLLEQSQQAPAEPQVATPRPEPSPVATPDFDETLSKTLLLAQRTADQTVAAAEAEAAALLESSRAEADSVRQDAAAARAEAMADVTSERERLLAEAHIEVNGKVEAALAALAAAEGEQRDTLLAEIEALRAQRTQLIDEIESLEGHVAGRRTAIRAALADIGAIIDDPNQLKATMPPTSSGLSSESPTPTPIGLDLGEAAELAPDGTEVDDRPSPSVAPTSSATFLGEGHAPAEDGPVLELADAANDADLADGGLPTERVDAVRVDHDDEVSSDADVSPDAGPEAATTSSTAQPDGFTATGEDLPWLETETADEADPTTLDSFVNDWTGEEAPEGSVGRRSSDIETQSWDDDGTDGAFDRPAWADSVPGSDHPEVVNGQEAGDNFLNELRRVTSEESDPDDEIERFMNNPDDEDERRGWFSRRK